MIYISLLVAPLLLSTSCSDSGFTSSSASRSASYDRDNDSGDLSSGSPSELPGGWTDPDGDGIYENNKGDETLNWTPDSGLNPDEGEGADKPGNDTDGSGNGNPSDRDSEKITGEYSQDAGNPVDYLFVVDNSSSMNTIISKLKNGFGSIAETADFPPSSRIGVISTSVPEVTKANAKIVGYKKLVTSQQIANSSRSQSSKSEHPGCDGWFTPQQTDAAGSYCLESAIDFDLIPTLYEAGLSSFYNFVTARQDKAEFFRDGSVVNVIFVSDTHDPGRGDATAARLLKKAQDYTVDEFLKEVRKKAKVDSIKYHGIVPIKGQGKCGSESVENDAYTYDKFITGTGGSIVECGKSNYAQFVTDMVANSKFKTKLFKLPDGFTGEITDVQIEGNSVQFDHYKNQNAILIKDIPSNLVKVNVDIFY